MYNGGNEEMNLDYAKIKEAAKNYEKDMTKFLRDIVKFPGESCDETVSYTHLDVYKRQHLLLPAAGIW